MSENIANPKTDTILEIGKESGIGGEDKDKNKRFGVDDMEIDSKIEAEILSHDTEESEPTGLGEEILFDASVDLDKEPKKSKSEESSKEATKIDKDKVKPLTDEEQKVHDDHVTKGKEILEANKDADEKDTLLKLKEAKIPDDVITDLTTKIDPLEGKTVKAFSDLELSDDEVLVYVTKDGKNVPISQVVDDWKNNADWKSSNTQKAMDHAAEVKTHKEGVVTHQANVNDFVEKQEKLSQDPNLKAIMGNEKFLDETDKYFEDEEGGNPVRSLVETHKKWESYKKDAAEKAEKEIKVVIETELAEVQKSDESFKEQKNIDRLNEVSQREGVTYKTAFKLIRAETLETENKDLTEKNDKLSTELKARNKELKEAQGKIAAGVKPEDKTTLSGSSPKHEEHEKAAANFDAAEDRIKEDLGIK